MKPAAAFAVGLWTGALVMAGVGVFYLRTLHHDPAGDSPEVRQQLEARIQTLQQDQARAAAEAQRLRQTITELRAAFAAQPPPAPPAVDPARSSRTTRWREPGSAPGVENWIVEAVLAADAAALPKLEQAAAQNDLYALDALALLADRDDAAALTRAWAAPTANAATKERATMLLAATLELNPHGEELLTALTRAAGENAGLISAAGTGLAAPNFSSRLLRGTGVLAPPLFKPDYVMRARVADTLRAAAPDEQVAAVLDRVREKIAARASEPTGLGQ